VEAARLIEWGSDGLPSVATAVNADGGLASVEH
jgi:hypothetical protein